MKISGDSKNIYINWNAETEKNGKSQNNQTIFAGNVKGFSMGLIHKQKEEDPIAARKAEAVKKAVKMLTDTFASDQKLDESIADSEEKIQQMEEKSSELMKKKEGYQEQIRQYEEDPNLSEEEKESATAALKEGVENLQKQIDANTQGVLAGRKGIEDVKIEMLKSHDMVDASVKEDKALKAASKDAAYSMLKEGANTVDEKIKEIVEAAEKKKEEKEEEKEAEEAKEIREARYEGRAEVAKKTPAGSMAEGVAANDEELQRKLQKLKMDELLTDDELLGIMVDALA